MISESLAYSIIQIFGEYLWWVSHATESAWLIILCPLSQQFSALPIRGNNIWLALMSTPSIRGNSWHTYISLLFYIALETLSFSDHFLSDTIPRISLAYEFQKGIQLDLGLILSQTNHSGLLSGCVPRDWKLGCPPISKGPGHPPPTFTIRSQYPLTVRLVLGNTGILLTHKGKGEKEAKFRFPWRAFKRWWFWIRK